MKALYFLLFGACLLTYANCLNNGFISDDVPAILENPAISHPLKFWLDPPAFFNSFGYLAQGTNPFIYHSLSIILHGLNTILVFLFLKLFFKTGASFLGALFFAVHPVHSEAVTWISGKPYLFLTFFILVSYLAYYRAGSPATRNGNFSPVWYCASLAGFSYFIISYYYFFALFPLLLILSDAIFGRWKRCWRLWLPFIAIVLLRLFLAQGAVQSRISAVSLDAGAPITNAPILYFVYSFYAHLWLLIWPQKLTFYHDPAILTPALRNYAVLYLIPVIFLLLVTFKKAKKVFFGISIFIIFLSPTFSPVPVAALVAERYIYFPSVALSIFIAFLLEKTVNFRKYILPLLIFIVLAYGARTVLRNGDWKSADVFWRKTLEVSPLSARAHNSMALIYLKEQDWERAINECKRAIEIDPRHIDAYNNLGLIYKERGDKERSELAFKEALKINPRYASAWHNLGNLYNGLGNKEEAASFYKKAIELEPGLLKAYNNLGNLYIDIGKNKEAILIFKKALEIYPRYALAHFNLSVAYFNEKEYALAIKHSSLAQALGLVMPSGFLKSLEPFRRKQNS